MLKSKRSRTKRKLTHADVHELTIYSDCHKCGGKNPWVPDVEDLTWRCVYCSNILYYTSGQIEQQIDIILKNNIRRKEYVRRGNTIIPKPNELVEMLRLKRRLQMERAREKIVRGNRSIPE